ncbi:MAG TPA: hypothetical protein VF219_08535 [Vicinamibacterales bacterium]
MALAFVWTHTTIVFLFVVSSLILVKPSFALNLGFIQTTGRVGLLATFVPAVAALAAGLWFAVRRSGGGLLVLAFYSAFWAVVFAGGLPAIWNARRSFCLKGLDFCIISPWVARLTLMSIILPFLLAAIVFLAEAQRRRAPDAYRRAFA